MFKRLINDAKEAAGAIVLKYVARASIAVPFLIAAGFATAALTVLLVEWYGSLKAYLIMAGGFAVIGVITTMVVTVKEQEEEIKEAEAERSDTPQMAADVALQAPLALLSGLLASPVGPSSALGIFRLIRRNLPLVLLLAFAGFLLWPRSTADESAEGETAEGETDPAEPVATGGPQPNGAYAETGDEARA